MKAFGLNRMDISQREGKYPPPLGSSEILGVEFSGIVSNAGTDISEWKVGDEVLGLVGGVCFTPAEMNPQLRFLGCLCRVHCRPPHTFAQKTQSLNVDRSCQYSGELLNRYVPEVLFRGE